jgi:hypothetical protein
MLPDNRTQCYLQLPHLSEYAAASRKHIMKIAEDMLADTDTLPDAVKPYGEAMTKFILEVLIESYAETLRLISELGLQEIARTALPPNHQSEKEE